MQHGGGDDMLMRSERVGRMMCAMEGYAGCSMWRVRVQESAGCGSRQCEKVPRMERKRASKWVHGM
jgi:hypothetical protein